MGVDYAAVVRDRVVWVAEERATLVGVLVFQLLDDHLLIENLAVAPRAQRTGLGARLLGVAELAARDAGGLGASPPTRP